MPSKWGHFFTLTDTMAVAILEEVNNHADLISRIRKTSAVVTQFTKMEGNGLG